MKNFIRAPLLMIITMVIIAIVAGPILNVEKAMAANTGATVIQNQTTALTVNGGNVIKETACSVLNSSKMNNATFTTLTYLPSTTIRLINVDGMGTYIAATTFARFDQDVGTTITANNTITINGAKTYDLTTVATEQDIGVSSYTMNTAITSVTTTANTANFYTDVGFVSENMVNINDSQTLANANNDDTGAMLRLNWTDNFAASITFGANSPSLTTLAQLRA